MNYIELLEAKRHTLGSFGFEPVWMPECAFGFQEAIINLEHAATRFDDVAGQTQDDLFA